MLRASLDADRHGAHVQRARASGSRLRAAEPRRLRGLRPGSLAVSMRKRLTHTGHTVHGLLDVGTTPVCGRSCSPGVLRSGGPAARSGAARWPGTACPRCSSACRTGAWEVQPTRPYAPRWRRAECLDAPVRAAVRNPVPSVPPGQLAIDLEMIAGSSAWRSSTASGYAGRWRRPTCSGRAQSDRATPRAARRLRRGRASTAAGQIPKLFLLLREGTATASSPRPQPAARHRRRPADRVVRSARRAGAVAWS